MSKKLMVNIGLSVVVLVMAYLLFASVKEPIDFENAYVAREEATIEKLMNIRTAQKTYLEVHGTYAKNFSKLINTIRTDSVLTVKMIGDPNDTAVQVQYDTIRQAILDVIEFQPKSFRMDSMMFIPYGNGAQFTMDAGMLEKQRIKIPVFEVTADKNAFCAGLNPKYIKNKKNLKVGSMTEGSDAGNWE